MRFIYKTQPKVVDYALRSHLKGLIVQPGGSQTGAVHALPR
jgi:hypothetical protein